VEIVCVKKNILKWIIPLGDEEEICHILGCPGLKNDGSKGESGLYTIYMKGEDG